LYIKKISQPSGLLDEIEGSVQGHRDGHGFLIRDDGDGDIFLSPNEMRAVLHKDRVKVRIVRQDRKGRPEGRVVEIVERPAHPIIGRLLNEGGIWIVAPEDKRYGQDILIPKVGIGTGKPAGWLSQSVVAGAAPVLWCCQGAQAAGGGCAAGESALSARGPAGVGLPLGIQPLGDGVL
jgi:cold shock CspA family protein